jgi:hypothetical protein
MNSSNFGDGAAFSADGSTLAVGAWVHASNFSGIKLGPSATAEETSLPAAIVGAVYVFNRVGSAYQQVAFIKPLVTDPGTRVC